jgi:glucose-1-phosphate thymidylyltransferase
MRPLSDVINKHLLPVYDTPLIVHPVGTLREAGVRDLLLVTSPEHVERFRRVLGDGEEHGCRIRYAEQEQPLGTGAAVLLAEEFVEAEDFAVILGDNIFTERIGAYRARFQRDRRMAAQVLLSRVRDPRQYGMAVLAGGMVVNIVEKPADWASPFASTGLWMLRPEVFERLRQLRKSPRGEYEMTDVLAEYAREGRLGHSMLKRKWMDVGTFRTLQEARVHMRRASSRRQRRSSEHAAAAAQGFIRARAACG